MRRSILIITALLASLFLIVPLAMAQESYRKTYPVGGIFASDMGWLRSTLRENFEEDLYDVHSCSSIPNLKNVPADENWCMVVTTHSKSVLIATPYNYLLWKVVWVDQEVAPEDRMSESGIHTIMGLAQIVRGGEYEWMSKLTDNPLRVKTDETRWFRASQYWEDSLLVQESHVCWKRSYDPENKLWADVNWQYTATVTWSYVPRNGYAEVVRATLAKHHSIGMPPPEQVWYLLGDLIALFGSARCGNVVVGEPWYTYPSPMLLREGKPFFVAKPRVQVVEEEATELVLAPTPTPAPKRVEKAEVAKKTASTKRAVRRRPELPPFTPPKWRPVEVYPKDGQCIAQYMSYRGLSTMRDSWFAPMWIGEQRAIGNACDQYVSVNALEVYDCTLEDYDEMGDSYLVYEKTPYCHCVMTAPVRCGRVPGDEGGGALFNIDFGSIFGGAGWSQSDVDQIDEMAKQIETLRAALEMTKKTGFKPTNLDFSGKEQSESTYKSSAVGAQELYKQGFEALTPKIVERNGKKVKIVSSKKRLKAYTSFSACIELDPNHVPCMWELGWVFWTDKQYEITRDLWERVEQLDPKHKKVRGELLKLAKQKAK